MNIPIQPKPSQDEANKIDERAPDTRSLTEARTVSEVLAHSNVEPVLKELDDSLVGLAPVKSRIRDIAALLVIDKLRLNWGWPRKHLLYICALQATLVPVRLW